MDADDKPLGDWFVRMWDGPLIDVAAKAPNAADPIHIGDNIDIRVEDGWFRPTDHWTFAARVSTGRIDWPMNGSTPITVTPHGPKIHYTRLATLTPGASGLTAGDCRPQFVPLAEQKTLVYRGGDGQTAFLGDAAAGFVKLGATLRVAVVRNQLPVAGAKILWRTRAGQAFPSSLTAVAGSAPQEFAIGPLASQPLTTDESGMCEVTWALNAAYPLEQHFIEACLADDAGHAIGPPIQFSACFATAARTSYKDGDCSVLQGAKTVQEALDRLCEAIPKPVESMKVEYVRFYDNKSAYPDIVENSDIHHALDLAGGLEIAILGDVATRPRENDPILDVELELPYPTTSEPQRYWTLATAVSGNGLMNFFATQRIRLSGNMVIKSEREKSMLIWKPAPPAQQFLETSTSHRFGQVKVRGTDVEWHFPKEPEPIICRLRLRGTLLWSGKPPENAVYLNGEALGFEGKFPLQLNLRSVDPQRAADLEMFFYLDSAPIRKPRIIRRRPA